MRRFIVILCCVCGVVLLASPKVWAQSGDDLPSPTFIPPVEADFYGGDQYNVTSPLGISVSTFDRSLRVYRTDLIIPGCELPLQASFVYSSKRNTTDSPFGRGWQLGYATKYTKLNDGSLIIGPIQGQTRLYWPGAGDLSTNGPDRYQLRLSDGTIYYFDDPEHDQVTKIESQSGNYLVMAYSSAGRLLKISDRYARSLSFSYGYRAGDYRLVRVSDNIASPVRTVNYSYDAGGVLAAGSLTKSEYPVILHT